MSKVKSWLPVFRMLRKTQYFPGTRIIKAGVEVYEEVEGYHTDDPAMSKYDDLKVMYFRGDRV